MADAIMSGVRQASWAEEAQILLGVGVEDFVDIGIAKEVSGMVRPVDGDGNTVDGFEFVALVEQQLCR